MICEKLLSCCLMATVIVVLVQCQMEFPKVCTLHVGCYIGITMESFYGETFEAFLGIPYAFPPKRFQLAVLYNSKETHSAQDPSDECIQKNYFIPTKAITGSEDCLYLNVYKPKLLTDAIPVLVYIHGGGFSSGTTRPNITGPEYLMDQKNVILVTLAYRLGAFGFLTTNDDAIPGNIGLKDQHVALTWIYQNIEHFGGDRERITLFGHDAGAVSAHMHMLSKRSKNLFNAIIAISGTANVPWAIDEEPLRTARLTAKYCNITNWDTINTHELKKILRMVSPNTMLEAGDQLKYWDVDYIVNYRPVIEKHGGNAFLDDYPVNILQSGNYTPVPIMFGHVPNEGGYRVVPIMESEELRNDFNEQFFELLKKFLEFPTKFNDSQIIEKTDLIINEYLLGVRELKNETERGFMDLVTHRFFLHPLYNAIKMHVETIDTDQYPVYMFRFNFLGSVTFADVYADHPTGRQYGVVYSNDLIYLFKSSIFPDFNEDSPSELDAIEAFEEDFVYFAHNRKPKIDEKYSPCNKTTFSREEGKICDYEDFTTQVNGYIYVIISNDFDTKRMKFWDDLLK